MACDTSWSDWTAVEDGVHLSPIGFAETLDGGQAFRWRHDGNGVWTGVWDRHVCRLRLASDGRLLWSAPVTLEKSVAQALPRYLGAAAEARQAADLLPWRTDAVLARCLAAFPDLRILRQPFGETLLAFLCSATKQIVQIKQMCENMAERFGDPLAPGYYALPTWGRLAEVPEAELRACGLGFRARYIKATALILAEDPAWLIRTEALPYEEAKQTLVQLPGVGEKVADCVLLFGAGQGEAFPVDVWILRVMEKRYGLQGWTNAQVAHFGRVHFGPLAGLAQQFLFAAERRRIFAETT
jgi:N-glycosylase/DNA lyase